jgi:hypothetical protein
LLGELRLLGFTPGSPKVAIATASLSLSLSLKHGSTGVEQRVDVEGLRRELLLDSTLASSLPLFTFVHPHSTRTSPSLSLSALSALNASETEGGRTCETGRREMSLEDALRVDPTQW